MIYQPSDIKWEVLPQASATFRPIEAAMSTEEIKTCRAGLKEFLCAYFSAEKGCSTKLGDSISPIGGTPAGGKCLKVRWAIPGRGKSGSLRIAVVAYCDDRKVKLAGAWVRKDDPGDAEFEAATAGA